MNTQDKVIRIVYKCVQ